MKLPTREQAEAYFDDFHVPDNFKHHCFLVNKIAVSLAEELKAAGEPLNLDLVDILSLLHDLFKPAALERLTTEPKFKCYPTKKQIEFWKAMKKKYKAKHETALFAEVFDAEFPEFAKLMLHYGNHDMLTSKKSREEQIVHYADWRVYCDEIISLKQRTDDLLIRYKHKIEENKGGLALWQTRVADECGVEISIFHKLKIKPEQLAQLIQ